MSSAKKQTRCTNVQVKKLVEYMSLNTMFANGEFTGPLGSRKQEAQRSELKELLKELGPDKEMASKLAAVFRSSLAKRPVATNTLVYATFYSAAELSQQAYNKFYTPESPDMDLASASRIVAVGSTVYAPTLYYWYKFLDKKFVGTAVKTVMTKVACEQFIMTPILLATFYTLIGVLEKKPDVLGELKEKYLKTLAANQAFWLPGQTINFFFIPSHLRVVYVASASFVWINILCFIKRQRTEKS